MAASYRPVLCAIIFISPIYSSLLILNLSVSAIQSIVITHAEFNSFSLLTSLRSKRNSLGFPLTDTITAVLALPWGCAFLSPSVQNVPPTSASLLASSVLVVGISALESSRLFILHAPWILRKSIWHSVTHQAKRYLLDGKYFLFQWHLRFFCTTICSEWLGPKEESKLPAFLRDV